MVNLAVACEVGGAGIGNSVYELKSYSCAWCIKHVEIALNSFAIAALLLVSVAAHGAETPKCTFVVAYVDYKADWLVSHGRATVARKGRHFEANLIDERDPNGVSHRLTGTITSNDVNATLTNLFSDAGTDKLRGTYFHGDAKLSAAKVKVSESLIVQNGLAFASLACFGESASFTARSSQPSSVK